MPNECVIIDNWCTGKKTITGSIKETEYLLELLAEKGLRSMIEVDKVDYLNQEMERLERNGVRYSFVLNVANLE